MSDDTTRPGDHLGDRLSALLDGELTGDDARMVEAHLAECPLCRGELAATASVRSLVRALPAVDPPFGVFERLIRRGPVTARAGGWRRAVAVAAAGAAAAVTLLLLATPAAEPVDPPVGDLVARHAASSSAGGDPVTELVPVGVNVPFEP